MSYFAQNLKFLRTSHKLSQEALGEKIGLNRGNIASYEKGSAEPSLTNLLKISRYFGIEVSNLLETNIENHYDLLQSLSNKNVSSQNNLNAPLELESSFREKLLFNKRGLEDFRQKSDEMSKILEGFRQFHKFKMESAGPISDDVRKMADDYEKLMEVLEDVLRTNKNIIQMLEQAEES